MEEAAFELGLDTGGRCEGMVEICSFVAARKNACSGPIIWPSLCWNWDFRDD